MARLNLEGRHTWFAPSELGGSTAPLHDSTFVRLWRGFMIARVMVAVVVLLLQILQHMMAPTGNNGALVLGSAYLVAVVVARLTSTPVPRGSRFDRQWQLAIGMDVVFFALLQWTNPQFINYAPLLALPVLLASVMGSLLMALATAAAVTLLLQGLAWQASLRATVDFVPAFFQAGLTGIGYFGVAILANQLASRLLREEQLTQRSQHAMKLQTQVNELVIETLSHGVIVVDALGTVRAANPAARQLMAPQRRLLTVPFALAEESGWQPLMTVATTTFSRKASQAKDLAIQHPQEVARRVHVRTRLTSNDESPSESLCVVFIEDLPEQEARLRQEKMVAMGRMSAAVAHEIRNPLAAIMQANALLAEDLIHPAQQRLTTMIGQNAQRLARIVDDVLNVARVPRQSEDLLPTVALDDAVLRFSKDWCAQNKSNNKVHLSLNAPDFTVTFDPEHLRRVLVNLLDNAGHYSSQAQDAIVVFTQFKPVESADGSQVMGSLRVWSDGERLDPTVQRHLFEPFFSSESRSSGLGLYICGELCQRHGAALGYTWALSRGALRNKEGNCFYVDFKPQRGDVTPPVDKPPDT